MKRIKTYKELFEAFDYSQSGFSGYNQIIVIGPKESGKSTICEALARKLKIDYIDIERTQESISMKKEIDSHIYRKLEDGESAPLQTPYGTIESENDVIEIRNDMVLNSIRRILASNFQKECIVDMSSDVGTFDEQTMNKLKRILTQYRNVFLIDMRPEKYETDRTYVTRTSEDKERWDPAKTYPIGDKYNFIPYQYNNLESSNIAKVVFTTKEIPENYPYKKTVAVIKKYLRSTGYRKYEHKITSDPIIIDVNWPDPEYTTMRDPVNILPSTQPNEAIKRLEKRIKDLVDALNNADPEGGILYKDLPKEIRRFPDRIRADKERLAILDPENAILNLFPNKESIGDKLIIIQNKLISYIKEYANLTQKIDFDRLRAMGHDERVKFMSSIDPDEADRRLPALRRNISNNVEQILELDPNNNIANAVPKRIKPGSWTEIALNAKQTQKEEIKGIIKSKDSKIKSEKDKNKINYFTEKIEKTNESIHDLISRNEGKNVIDTNGNETEFGKSITRLIGILYRTMKSLALCDSKNQMINTEIYEKIGSRLKLNLEVSGSGLIRWTKIGKNEKHQLKIKKIRSYITNIKNEQSELRKLLIAREKSKENNDNEKYTEVCELINKNTQLIRYSINRLLKIDPDNKFLKNFKYSGLEEISQELGIDLKDNYSRTKGYIEWQREKYPSYAKKSKARSDKGEKRKGSMKPRNGKGEKREPYRKRGSEGEKNDGIKENVMRFGSFSRLYDRWDLENVEDNYYRN